MAPVRFERDDATKGVEFDFPAPDSLPSVLAIAYHKAGSVLLDGIIKSICEKYGRPYFNIETELFHRGEPIARYQNAVAPAFVGTGRVYGVHRMFLPAFADPRLSGARIIVLIRDPRDAAVSYYYSARNSHFIPKQGDTRDELMKQRSKYESAALDKVILDGSLDFMFSNIARISEFITANRATIDLFRYEDVIFEKYRWIKAIGEILSVPLSEEFISRLLTIYDILPKVEDPNKHIRSVVPGDYLRKMSPEAIDSLNNRYGRLFQTLGYL